MMRKAIPLIFILVFITPVLPAQIVNPVKWAFSSKQIDQQQIDLIFRATIASPWHMYGLNIPENGPIPMSINLDPGNGFEKVGKPSQSPKPKIIDDKIFNMQLELHSGQVTFVQRIRKTQSDSIVIKGTLEYMTCSDVQCVMGDADFTFRLKGTEETARTAIARAETETAGEGAEAVEQSPKSTPTDTSSATVTANATAAAQKSLWGVFFLSLFAGLGGLLTPCVYPMIPMTVSYFLRGNKPRSRAIGEALVFGLSIILLYTLIGVLVALFKNPNAVNNFTTHWIPNLIFFLIFILLSASFFGMFEIMLPSGMANKVDQQADKGGYIGAFFMALAMAILSFSCTGPIVASLLIKASQGEVLEPIIGMAGFSVVFALPFTLFAVFPAWLQRLPKSGNWLNAVKVVFAFIMLAFSLYFLGKIDQSYHLNLLSRDLFISIWVVIFILLGFYLLGKIKFIHDGELSHIGVPRFIFAVTSFSFALYLSSGLVGNELKGLSTILPPAEMVKRNDPGTARIMEQAHESPSALCSVPKYADFLTLPHGLRGYFDYDEALACAREQSKPVLVDFVGHTCSNCKKMYAEVWSDPRVLDILSQKFIIVALYTDDKTRTSSVDGKTKNTIGRNNQDLQITRFNSNALPLYAIVDGNGNTLSSSYYTYDPNVEKFIAWLEDL